MNSIQSHEMSHMKGFQRSPGMAENSLGLDLSMVHPVNSAIGSDGSGIKMPHIGNNNPQMSARVPEYSQQLMGNLN